MFNNGAVGSCWSASPGSLAGADSHYIINCLLLGVRRDAVWLLESSLVLGKQPLPPASRFLLINVCLSLGNSSLQYGVHVAVVASSAASRQGDG